MAAADRLPPKGTNVAPLVPYTLSPRPNAEYALEKTGRELTDGVVGFGRFWSNGTSIGWERRSPVQYQQRFTQAVPIDKIEIGTGASTRSAVALPSHAMVYVANDDGRFRYVGDAREPWQRDELSKNGMKSMKISFSPLIVREVIIVLFRDSSFLFLDEVQITAAKEGSNVEGDLTSEQITPDAINRRRSESERRAGQGPLGNLPNQRYAWPLAQTDIKSTEQKCTSTRVSPWIEGAAQELLVAQSVPNEPSFHVKGGWLVAAFRLENHSDSERVATIKFGATEGVEPAWTSIVAYALGLDYKWRTDVVIRINSVSLPPRSYMLLLTEAPIQSAGNLKLEASVRCGEDQERYEITGRAVPIEDQSRPYGNLWSYLNGPIARTQTCWPSFHQDMGVDTAVVNETALNKDINKEAEALLRTYLRTFSKARRMLLYMEMTDPSWTQSLDDKILEGELRSWWAWVSNVIKEEKFGGEVVLYPIDEVKPDQVERLNAISRVLRRVSPSTRIYGTIGAPEILSTVDLDILQVIESALPHLPREVAQKKEIQIYATRPGGKSLSLNNYYRKLSWLAFGASLSGSGLWSMWDSSGMSSPQSGWSDFGGSERDFGLVYGSIEGCVHPSRRLLAWRHGLEEMAVLNACNLRIPLAMLREHAHELTLRDDLVTSDYDETLAALTRDCADQSGLKDH
ncbi:hypothetical protein VB618_19580 [Microvirga sp. CF3062]|uniref:hypothetical protein n=1 Tax=Microvirga sp. CF3062 TaxID=3110182 RepID=UPI002E7A019D|nr:hypothetical protein [Microvirga sp. CF3062]MEE1658406.1 hypothetical protein [Microvirga sp. CF3062]